MLLITVPKRTCTYQQLRNMVLQKMWRYVRTPQTDDWWKEEKIADEGGSDGSEEKSVEADVEMNHDEQNNENDDYSVNNKDRDQPADGEAPVDEFERCMFTFSLVNSYGSSELDKVEDDDKPIKLTNKSHLAVDWNVKAKKLFFDERESELMEVHDSMHSHSTQKRKSIALNECLDLFTTRERLGAHDPWFCPDCKKHQQATKKFDVWQVPNVLVVHLKRFSYDRYYRDKLDVLIDFPLKDLNMGKWLRNPVQGVCTFDLIGIVNHYGGLGAGHYTAFAQNKDDQKWYHFDDSSVTPAGEDNIITKAAYVLIYQRRDVTEAQQKSANRNVSAAAGAPAAQNGNCSTSDDEMDIN